MCLLLVSRLAFVTILHEFASILHFIHIHSNWFPILNDKGHPYCVTLAHWSWMGMHFIHQLLHTLFMGVDFREEEAFSIWWGLVMHMQLCTLVFSAPFILFLYWHLSYILPFALPLAIFPTLRSMKINLQYILIQTKGREPQITLYITPSNKTSIKPTHIYYARNSSSLIPTVLGSLPNGDLMGNSFKMSIFSHHPGEQHTAIRETVVFCSSCFYQHTWKAWVRILCDGRHLCGTAVNCLNCKSRGEVRYYASCGSSTEERQRPDTAQRHSSALE